MRSRFTFCKVFIFLIGLIDLAHSSSFAQGLSESQVDSIVKRDLKLFQVPGIAVGIIKDGRLIYNKGFGVRSLANQKLVDSKTLFGIASNTKAFTAAAIGLLVDEGKIKWDDKVIRYIPEFRLYDPLATNEITIRDLLCHRSGLGTGVGDLMHDPDSTDFTVNDIIHNLRYLKPSYSFRSKFSYDNNLYLVAGEVIARVSKMPWEKFIKQRILGPLGMQSSAASYDDCKYNPNIIDAHKTIADSVVVVTRYASTKDDAAGGIYSNLEDMSKWLNMFINDGKYGEHTDMRLLSSSTARELLSPQTLIPVNYPGLYNTHFGAYGLGWFMVDVKGYKQIFHDGEDVGMVSEVMMIPELELGIIVLTNSESNVTSAIANQITDSYLGLKGIDRAAEMHTRLTNSEEAASKLKIQLSYKVNLNQGNHLVNPQRFTGIYHDQWFGNVVISILKNQLWFRSQRSPQLKGVLLPYGDNTFYIKWQNPEIDSDALVCFTFKTNGTVQDFILKPAIPGMGYNFDDLDFKKMLGNQN